MAKKKVWTEEDLIKEEIYREKWSETAIFLPVGPELDSRMKENMQAAKNTIKKKNIDTSQPRSIPSIPISIKVKATELDIFKSNAAEEGLKYQTKLNQLIYQYNRGQLKVVIE